jgi:hypothetical protein
VRDMPFKCPTAACFFNHSPNTLIMACIDGIFSVDIVTQSTQPFSSTPRGAFYQPHALALSDDDFVLLAGNFFNPFNVCGYDTASRTRLWIYDTINEVAAVCMHGTHALVTVFDKPTLVLDHNTGAHIASLQKADGNIFGLGVIEGLCFVLSRFSFPQTPTSPCTSPCCSTSSPSKPSLCICRWRCGTGSRSTACSYIWLL